ncbi:MAG: ParA family protein [Eggerthellaceae bacterium]|nr:ParA family protein [Eggerthellaceae bacterium]
MLTLSEAVPFTTERLVIVCGHYGVGKTNFALNLAIDTAKAGHKVTLVDLDIVNPYFRSSDYGTLLDEVGIELVAPVLAGTSVDVPSLSPRVFSAIERAQTGECITIIDAGGDDVGAGALGRFSGAIRKAPYTMIVVVNAYRNLTQTVGEAVTILREIETSSKLSASCVVNNSHLKQSTTKEALLAEIDFGEKVASQVDVPCVCTCIPKTLANADVNGVFADSGHGNIYPVSIYVKTPWE